MEGKRLLDPGFLSGSSASRSFRDALTGSSTSNSTFPDLKVSSFRGLPSLWISDEEVLALASSFEFALVGKFPTHRPSLEAIRKFFFNLKLNGVFSVTVLNSKHILIKLENDMDYCRVFAHRSYFVNNCFMKIFKWTHTFDIDVESPSIPIWVSFPNLRPHLFAPRILFGLGSMFGKPLKIDHATSSGRRPSIARVLVELDVTKVYPDKIWLGSESLGYIQSVIMDPFPSYCSHCKSLGHSKLECPSFQPRVVVASVAEVTPVSLDSNLPSTVPPVVPVMLGSDSANVAVNNAIVSLEGIGCATHSPLCSDHVVRPVSVSPVLAGLGNVEMAVVTEVAGNANGFESVAILSPDAQPFTPTDLNLSSKRGCHSVEDPPREVPLLSVVSAQAVLASQSLNSGDLVVPFQSPAVDNLVEEVCRVAVLGNSSPIRNERVVLNDCVDVPVTYLDPKSFQYNVKDNSGVDLRVHLDWLHDYNSVSESESGSDSVESLGDGDPGNSFNLLRDKPLVTAASRGRSRGRGKCGR
ncbi:hypothetical protein KFK09_015392 [Dendrobium nobile]|uniref:DUF4283 domain-containing protein n=1 Tax=Dendrobium nobile TaxID=94219 RepID=A0A8T3B4P1_DENNO|nr:hypothetical protein KFK09_015392 [Dendrobium nobile]